MLDFFNLKYEAFGLEISDSFVRAAQFKRRNNVASGLATRSEPLAGGIVKDGEVKDQRGLILAIKRVVAATKKEKKIPARHVVVSLPENKAFLEIIQMPRLAAEDLRAAVAFEAENYIPLPIEKVYLDFEIIENSQAPADHLDVLLVAMPRAVVDPYASVIKAAGLNPLAFEPESQAVIRSLTLGKSSSGSLMIMQIGDSRSNLIIYAANYPRFTFSIPISNSYFLETIAKAMKVSEERAEVLKTTFGISTKGLAQAKGQAASKKDSGESKKIFEAMIPGLVDFIQQASRCLEYYKNHAAHEHGQGGEGRVGKVILCGSGANLKGLDELISLKLNVPVINGVHDPVPGEEHVVPASEKYSGSLAVVAGLAMRAASEGTRTVTLQK